MCPDQESSQGNGHTGQGDPFVAEKRLAAVDRQKLADDAQSGQYKDIDCRV